MMAVASRCGMLVSDPRFGELSQEQLALHGAQIEREEKVKDERVGILAYVCSDRTILPEDLFPSLKTATAVKTEADFERDVAIWSKGI